MTARILVCYGTSEGQTATIAERMADALAADGHDATLVNAAHLPPDLDLEDYDGAIVGASVHRGTHQRSVSAFVRDRVEALNRLPSAFFSVSLTAAGDDPESAATARDLLERFLSETDWEPDRTLPVAGALKYSQYGLLTRFVMRRIAATAGGGTDTSRDYEYTDWNEVEAFALEFAAALEST